MKEMLKRILEILDRFRHMEISSNITLFLVLALLGLGIMNLILGYRLLRFWVMLFGFGTGALGGYLIYRHLALEDHMKLFLIAGGAGVLLAVICFLIYKAGVFILIAGLTGVLSIYIIHPTTSALFFLCILLGIVCGSFSLRFSREIMITGTSILGGALSAFSVIKLAALREFPEGLAIMLVFSALGMVIQFATNRYPDEEEEGDEYEETHPGKAADVLDYENGQRAERYYRPQVDFRLEKPDPKQIRFPEKEIKW